MMNTMLGEVVTVIGNCVCIDNGLMLNKEQFELIELPKLNEDERKYYDEIKQAENGNKIKMVGDVIYDYEYDDDHCFTPEEVYRAIEAIVKGGYND
ncbi:hypothetical protein PND19_01015 [Ligilactobacillus ruminis]|uniref:hypothetical protein n=1 Tax=Ligilactobacillus ruminis TaxID=1623 RepID=UPI00232F6C74|nr:hypothetical protein [Ligilactobacillus ruminis]MDB7641217.1 hypothetical protein [Ligilactobacillus ruminis]MDB7646131.1 hypothetical protein [Ligilactobacillus ruminis]